MFFFPKIISRVFTINKVIHCLFEEDSPKYFFTIESRTFDDTSAHLVNKSKHFSIVSILTFVYPIEL